MQKKKNNPYQKINNYMDTAGKTMIFILIVILLVQFLFIFFVSFKAIYAHAQESTSDKVIRAGGNLNNEVTYPHLSVPVGEFSDSSFTNKPQENWIGEYVKAWYNYVTGAIGIVAVVMVMWGGILWITSGGNSSQISNAKDKIKNAIIGIVLLLLSYTIFKTVNPALLNLSLPKLDRVEEPAKVCCKNDTTKELTMKYGACSQEETSTSDLSDCTIARENQKKSMCPAGANIVTVKGPNDHPVFLEKAMENCGANVNDPNTWYMLNNNLTTPVDGLKYYDGEYFGCYACTDPLRNELGPT